MRPCSAVSNAFSQIAANLDPAVVNISTEAASENPIRGLRGGSNRNNQDPRQLDPFDLFNFFGSPDQPERNHRRNAIAETLNANATRARNDAAPHGE